MKTSIGSRLSLYAFALLLLPAVPSQAFPPAPHHLIFGLVRDEFGNPIAVTNATVTLETLSNVRIQTTIIPNLGAGVNYRLRVPMDSGLTADAYKPTALQPTVPFRLKVQIGQMVFLPIEMTGDYANLGKPARSTRIDLTLGEDSDHDGLPDAWERALLAALGGGSDISDIRPGDDDDGDGSSNLQEYLAGTYAFDPEDGFDLTLAGFSGPNALLEFLAIRGRTYTLLSSPDALTWTPATFRIPDQGVDAPVLDSYQATDVRTLRIEALAPEGEPFPCLFFRAQVR